MIEKKCLIILLFVAMLLTTGCTGRETKLRIAIGNMPLTFDPIMVNETVTGIVNRNIFETLLMFEGVHPVPLLATEWFAFNDTTMVVKFRKNARFSDGSPLTGEDIIASLNRAIHNPNSIVYTFNYHINSFQILNNNVLHIYHQQFQNISANIVFFLSRVPIHKASEILNNDDGYLRLNPMGTGEYFLVSATGNLITLHRNRYHRNYRINRSSPQIVELYYEPSQDVIFNKLKNNDLDMMLNVPLSLLDDVMDLAQFTIYDQAQALMSYLMFDISRDDTPGINLPYNPLKDQRIRRAIAHAMNIQGWVDDVFHGKVGRLAVPGYPHLFGYPDHLEPYRYNPELSKSLMEAAGTLDGFDMKISVANSRFYSTLGALIENDLRKININVQIDELDFGDFVHQIENNPPSAFLSVLLTPTQITHINNIIIDLFFYEPILGTFRNNHMRNQHTEIIEAIKNLRYIQDNDPRLNNLLIELAELVYEEAVVIPIFQHKNLHALNNRFTFNMSENYLFSSISRGWRR